MSKSKLQDILSDKIMSKLKEKFDKTSSQQIKKKLENYMPKSYNALKELYHININNTKDKDLDLAKKLKKYILSKIPKTDGTNEIDEIDEIDEIEDYPLLTVNNNDKEKEVSFDINNNSILIDNIVYKIVPLSVTNKIDETNESIEKPINNISQEILKNVINKIDAPQQIIGVISLGFEIKTIYDTILEASELISNAEQSDTELDNKINDILELCLTIIDTCQIAVDSEQQDNIELLDNISMLLNDLNNELTLLIKYIHNSMILQDTIIIKDFLEIIVNLYHIVTNIINNF